MTIRKHHPKWVDGAITPKRGAAAPKSSWWIDAAAPDQREQFTEAARKRDRERIHQFAASYAEADGEIAK